MHETSSAKAFAAHNHSQCAGKAMARAEALAAASGLRLTAVRRRVLEILLEEHRALGAYEVLERLARDGWSAQPPVAYRALDFLCENGLAHRIDKLNAYTACTEAGRRHAPVFLICASCNAIAELSGTGAARALRDEAASLGFDIEAMNIEATGLCPACKKVAQNAAD